MNIDFSDVLSQAKSELNKEEPTLKQRELVRDISYALGYPIPTVLTKSAYSEYIDRYMQEYKKYCFVEAVTLQEHYDNYGDRI